MRQCRRRTGTKVRNGKVQRKNRTQLSSHYSQVRQSSVVFDRLRPGPDYKHYLTIADVKRFVNLLPDWPELSVGLDAVILAEGGDSMGWHYDGVVAVCAWEREYSLDFDSDFVEDHASILRRLGVQCEPMQDDPTGVWCHFDDASIKGFQLMHILLHELGHHRDRMTTATKKRASRGEGYAEAFAIDYAEDLWESYFREFGW